MTGSSPERYGDSGAAAAARAAFTALAVLVLVVFSFYCALIAIWMWAASGEPGARSGDLAGGVVVLLTVLTIAITAVVVQLRWANRAASASAVTRRSLLVLAGPGAVILVLALAAS